jgi:hypothetical protein
MVTYVIMKVMSTREYMEREVQQQLFELANNTPPASLVLPLWRLAGGVLDAGYPREQLIEDFDNLRAHFEQQGEEEREDAVLEVMDFLYRWCSPHMKL